MDPVLEKTRARPQYKEANHAKKQGFRLYVRSAECAIRKRMNYTNVMSVAPSLLSFVKKPVTDHEERRDLPTPTSGANSTNCSEIIKITSDNKPFNGYSSASISPS